MVNVKYFYLGTYRQNIDSPIPILYFINRMPSFKALFKVNESNYNDSRISLNVDKCFFEKLYILNETFMLEVHA